jgi:phytoene/squalene synthetase
MSSLALPRNATPARTAPPLPAGAPPLRLLAPAVRGHVAALGGFVVRAAEGWADTGAPGLGIDAATAARIVEAFRKTERTPRIRRWSELLAWCRFAASPVARHMLALHGEDARLVPAAESFGTAIMLLRVVRNCRADYVAGRVLLPADWLREAGCAEDALGAKRTSPELRAVLDRVIARAERLIAEAGPTLMRINDRDFRRWSAVALALAASWTRALARRDPLRRDIDLSRPRRIVCLVAGIVRAARA